MKTFIAILSILAVAAADQTHTQSFKQGNSPAVTTSIHKPHGALHAAVHSQPSAQPSEVHQAYNEEKYLAGVHAPVPKYANKNVHAAGPVYHAAAPVVHAAPIVHAPAYHAPAPAYHVPAYHTPAPSYHAPAPAYHVSAPVHAPAYHAPTPVHAPAYHAPAPVHAPAYHSPTPVHAPAYHAPAPHAAGYQEPEYIAAPVYNYNYGVHDDYSGANFQANEDRDNYATHGEYRVALPDGRTQIVTYSVADADSGYVANVAYEGQAVYPEAPHPVKPHQ